MIRKPNTFAAEPGDDAHRPFSEFRDAGLLWLINTTVFHPRGYALAFGRDEEGNVIGWSLMGDGKEPWTFADPAEDQRPEGYTTIDELFLRVKELLK